MERPPGLRLGGLLNVSTSIIASGGKYIRRLFSLCFVGVRGGGGLTRFLWIFGGLGKAIRSFRCASLRPAAARKRAGVRVVEEVDSPRVKLLYDIYHMQIMEGDLIATIRANSRWIGHFHTGGVPGRHELDGRQEVQWDGVMRGIVETGYTGFVAHEFVPTGDPMASLRQAVELCDV